LRRYCRRNWQRSSGSFGSMHSGPAFGWGEMCLPEANDKCAKKRIKFAQAQVFIPLQSRRNGLIWESSGCRHFTATIAERQRHQHRVQFGGPRHVSPEHWVDILHTYKNPYLRVVGFLNPHCSAFLSNVIQLPSKVSSFLSSAEYHTLHLAVVAGQYPTEWTVELKLSMHLHPDRSKKKRSQKHSRGSLHIINLGSSVSYNYTSFHNYPTDIALRTPKCTARSRGASIATSFSQKACDLSREGHHPPFPLPESRGLDHSAPTPPK
jgi:hypothetical protein